MTIKLNHESGFEEEGVAFLTRKGEEPNMKDPKQKLISLVRDAAERKGCTKSQVDQIIALVQMTMSEGVLKWKTSNEFSRALEG